ncbi:hypothetical protein F4776DRAFT_207792 [Hypoxylon sp. NC0597]|nr:hypothetical protein F4776DRAFT_207792 [Hypoxylon sp. NC0597]
MNLIICSHCRMALRHSLRALRAHQTRSISSTASRSSTTDIKSIAEILSRPSWSVRSLLPSTESSDTKITPQTLHHLLRLSALPSPKSAEEESRMLRTLESQLHFVRAIREVDTTGVEPLRAIRDETAQGMREQTIGLEQLKEALAKEDIVGHARRPRRRRGIGGAGQKEGEDKADPEVEGWDVLGNASETAGRYFVVRTRSTGPAGRSTSQAGETKKS